MANCIKVDSKRTATPPSTFILSPVPHVDVLMLTSLGCIAGLALQPQPVAAAAALQPSLMTPLDAPQPAAATDGGDADDDFGDFSGPADAALTAADPLPAPLEPLPPTAQPPLQPPPAIADDNGDLGDFQKSAVAQGGGSVQEAAAVAAAAAAAAADTSSAAAPAGPIAEPPQPPAPNRDGLPGGIPELTPQEADDSWLSAPALGQEPVATAQTAAGASEPAEAAAAVLQPPATPHPVAAAGAAGQAADRPAVAATVVQDTAEDEDDGFGTFEGADAEPSPPAAVPQLPVHQQEAALQPVGVPAKLPAMAAAPAMANGFSLPELGKPPPGRRIRDPFGDMATSPPGSTVAPAAAVDIFSTQPPLMPASNAPAEDVFAAQVLPVAASLQSGEQARMSSAEAASEPAAAMGLAPEPETPVSPVSSHALSDEDSDGFGEFQ